MNSPGVGQWPGRTEAEFLRCHISPRMQSILMNTLNWVSNRSGRKIPWGWVIQGWKRCQWAREIGQDYLHCIVQCINTPDRRNCWILPLLYTFSFGIQMGFTCLAISFDPRCTFFAFPREAGCALFLKNAVGFPTEKEVLFPVCDRLFSIFRLCGFISWSQCLDPEDVIYRFPPLDHWEERQVMTQALHVYTGADAEVWNQNLPPEHQLQMRQAVSLQKSTADRSLLLHGSNDAFSRYPERFSIRPCCFQFASV